ncbi:ATP-binding cassette sub-family B member 9 [Lamellibrachia satsuma]|nr:ATP-binding cassette sub-family B member 9 [Lamellibrachia satsuma]
MFIRAIIFMVIFSAGSAIAAGLRGGFFKVAMARLNIRIRNHLFSSMLSQEIGFFDTIRTGDLTSRLTSDTSTMSDALSLNTNVFLRSLIKAVGVCVFMFTLSWRLSLITVIGLPIIMGVSNVYGTYYQTLSKKVQDSLAKANEVAEETCSSMRTVRSFANEPAETARYAENLAVTYKLKVKEAFAYAGYVWSNELFELMLVTMTLYYGGHLVVNDLMSGGELVSFILYQIELGSALESISYVYTGLMQAIGASQKVFEFIDRKPLVKPEGGNVRPNKLQGRIEFHNVSFAYPTRPDSLVLKNVSFSVDPGEIVALVGPSGGGKSSCINLLEHFYETQEGSVRIDNVSINDYDHKYLHTKIALVGQEPILYATSVKENIAYGLDCWDMELVERAAKLANAHEFIMDMKEKYDANTGEKGLQLSGGQKQRLAIARAVIRNPTILLLDEATSALDSESEYLVQEALYKNLKGRTVMIIAHRLSTVEKANRIIVIEKGSVVEQGSHTQLLARGGLYTKLVQRQLLGFDVGFSDHVTKPPVEAISSQGSFKSFEDLSEETASGGTPTKYGSW